MSHRPARPALWALLVATALAGCGTTVTQGAVGAGLEVRDGVTAPADPLAAPGLDVPGPSGPSGPSTSGGTTAGPGAGASGPTTSGPSAPEVRAGTTRRGPQGTVPGVTATTVRIGIYTAQGFSDFASSLGASIATGDNRAQAQAVVDHLNKNGGIGGRRIEPVFHDFDISLAATDINTEYERACAAWTQDQRVYAVVNPIGTANPTLYDCLSKAGVPTVSTGDSKDASFLSKYGDFFYQPVDMNQRRTLANNVDGLVAAGFFGAGAQVGVVHVDVPDEQAAVEFGLKPALARHGLRLAETFQAPLDNSAPAAYSNAVLRFKAAGVTHVLFTAASSPIAFGSNAESQNYYPRYGLQTKNSPSTLQTTMSPTTQRGAMGIGWQPMNDVDASRDPGRLNARQELCLRLMTQAGQDTSARATAVFGLWYCDMLFFLQDALLQAPSFAIADLSEGAESLASFQAASTFRSGLEPGRLHDGVKAYRMFAFRDDCSCYAYVTPLRTAS